jgi:hypothetical protein
MTLDEAILHAKLKANEQRHYSQFEKVRNSCIKCAEEHEQLAKWLEELKEYKQLEEQGLLLKLPCKIGATIWWLNGNFLMESEVVGFSVDEDGVSLIRVEYYDKKTDKTYMYTLDNYDFGKKVFLTKEEAEKALKEKEGAE